MKHFKSLIQKIKNPIVRKQQQGFFRTLFLFLPIILNAEHLEKQDLRVTFPLDFIFSKTSSYVIVMYKHPFI